jgi:predicted nucleic acid-binding protein
MAPQIVRKVVFDTNIYIRAIHRGFPGTEYILLIDSLPFTYLSSVVSAELYAGARDSFGMNLIQSFVSRSERVGRIVTPTHGTWSEAGRILAKIGKQEPGYKSKFPALFNDILIALSALQIGATVYTNNEEDFRLIRRHKRFSLETVGSRS